MEIRLSCTVPSNYNIVFFLPIILNHFFPAISIFLYSRTLCRFRNHFHFSILRHTNMEWRVLGIVILILRMTSSIHHQRSVLLCSDFRDFPNMIFWFFSFIRTHYLLLGHVDQRTRRDETRFAVSPSFRLPLESSFHKQKYTEM